MVKPTYKQPFMGIWFHDNRLPTDNQKIMESYLNRIFHYYRIFVDMLEFSKYIGNDGLVTKIVIIISDLERYSSLIKLTERNEERFQRVYVFLTVEVSTPNCFMTTNMKILYEKISTDLSDINNDIKSNQLVEDPFDDDLNLENICDSKRMLLLISVFDNKSEQTISIQQLTKESLEFLYFLTMIEILLQISHNPIEQTEMWEFCRKIYVNDAQLNYIDKLSMSYSACDAIKYYTGNPGLSCIVNQICRTRNFEYIFKFRVYITDLHKQLNKHSIQQQENDIKPCITQVYRGIVLPKSVIQQLIDNIGGLISMGGFLSTTVDPEVANIYAGYDHVSDEYRSVQLLFQINKKIRQPYAYIADQSLVIDDLEVLFSISTIWRVKSVNYTENPCRIKLMSCDEFDSQLNKLYENYAGAKCTLLSLGDILFELGKYYEAERVYQQMLDENSNSNEICRDLHYRIGITRFISKDYHVALEEFKKVESMFQLSNEVSCSQPLDPNCRQFSYVPMYNNMGIICEIQQKFQEAIRYYDKALQGNDSLLELATIYNQSGRLYWTIGSYNKARIHLAKAVDIIAENEPQRITFQENLDRVNHHLQCIASNIQQNIKDETENNTLSYC